MFWYVLPFFSCYAALTFYDEWRYHRGRTLEGREKFFRTLASLLSVAGIAYTLFVEYGDTSFIGFELIAAASILTFPLCELQEIAQLTSSERTLHSWIAMLHPLMWIFLGTTWRFIDGAGFFLGIVLPFSTKNLRPVAYGYFGVMAAFALYQIVYWNLIKRGSRSEPTPASFPSSAPEDVEQSIRKVG